MKNIFRKLPVCLFAAFLTAVALLPALAADYSCTATIPFRVTVENSTDTEFTVELKGESGAPLPEETSFTISGSGEGTFGPIQYTEPGDYVYTLSQVKGNAPYVTYDETVYTLTVRVTNDGKGGLTSEIWAVKDDSTQKSQEVLFSNLYAPPGGEIPQTGIGTEVPCLAALMVLSIGALGVLLKGKAHS